MQPGRTPEWNIVASLVEAAWLETADLSPDGRVSLPVALRRRVTWANGTEILSLLAKIERDGRISLAPLEEGREELDALSRSVAIAEGDEVEELVMAAMGSYSRVPLSPDGRVRLSPPLIDRLATGAGHHIWVGAFRDRVYLWSVVGFAEAQAAARGRLVDAVEAAGTMECG